MEPKASTEFFVGTSDESEMSTTVTKSVSIGKVDEESKTVAEQKASPVSASASASNLGSGSSLIQGEETVSNRADSIVDNPSSLKADKGRKSSTHIKNLQGKRKVKVDWTPELHRQFVQAVEQLGLDKAVPSKILELMGIDCLTRHNVASHLQKYRSHRKHLLAREAEAATWSRKRQMYGTTGRTGKRDVNSWVVPTTGFPPVTSMPQFRPLHVWGHPSSDQSLMYMWPNHLNCSPAPPPAWVPGHPLQPLISGEPSFWSSHHRDVPAPGVPCFPPHFQSTRFTTPPVRGVPPTSLYRAEPGVSVPIVPTGQTLPQSSFDSYPSKESIDAVIGDVLSNPWLPLPLGLKPPSIDSVMVELQRQGISKIPPTCA